MAQKGVQRTPLVTNAEMDRWPAECLAKNISKIQALGIEPRTFSV